MKYGCIFGGKSKSVYPNPKTDFAFFGVNPKTDHESIKSTLKWILQIKSKSERFWGKGFEESIFDKRFFEKINGAKQMPYMYDILSEPMLVAPL